MAYTKFGDDEQPAPATQQPPNDKPSKSTPTETTPTVVNYQLSDEELELPFPLGTGEPSKKRKRKADEQPFELVGKKDKSGSKRDPGEGKRLREERERLAKERMELPIWSGSFGFHSLFLRCLLITRSPLGQDAIRQAVKENDTVVILGETGSGKTTRTCLN